MKKLLAFFTVYALAATMMNAQNFEWARTFGGISYDDAFSLSVDASGNVYIVGNFIGTADFDPGAGTYNLTSESYSDVFIQKLDAAGNFIWAKAFGGTDYNRASSLSVDASGNVYTAGYFQGTVDFDPGAAAYNLTSAGGYDVFIQKLDAAGNFVWAKAFGGAGYDVAATLSVDAPGNVYTAGQFSEIVDFDPGAGTYNLTSEGYSDIFIQKLDAAGNFIWAKAFGGTDYDAATTLSVDASGNVYTAGYFEGTVDFDPGAGTYNLTSEGYSDVFIQKLDAAGNFIWAKAFGGTDYDRAYSLSVNASGNVYTAGWFEETVDFDPGAETYNLTSAGGDDIFIQKLDAAGNFIWAKAFGGASYDGTYSLSVDASDNVYTAGYFEGIVDFDPGAGTYNLISAGQNDAFIQKLDVAGNFIWAKAFGGVYNDYTYALSVDASGNVYTAGGFTGTADFDPEAGTQYLTSEGETDVFVHKMSQTSVGVIESDFGKQLLIYPNPGTGDFVIDLGHVYELAEIEITDLNGKLIYTNSLHQTQAANIYLPEAPAGVYLLRIRAGKEHAVVKLVKN